MSGNMKSVNSKTDRDFIKLFNAKRMVKISSKESIVNVLTKVSSDNEFRDIIAAGIESYCNKINDYKLIDQIHIIVMIMYLILVILIAIYFNF